MPGAWTVGDVNRPGALPGIYVNFQTVAAAPLLAGARGSVGIIATDTWGPINEVQTFTNPDQIDVNTLSSPERPVQEKGLQDLARLAFVGGASSVSTYRMAKTDGARATLVLQDTGTPTNIINLSARYPGEFGNDLRITVDTVLGSSSGTTRRRLRVYVDGYDNPVQTAVSTVNDGTAGTGGQAGQASTSGGSVQRFIEAINGAGDNAWVTATADTTAPLNANGGNGNVALQVQTAMTGGTAGTAPDTGDFDDALEAFESVRINLITTNVVLGTGAALTAMRTWVNGQRVLGNYVMGVVGTDSSAPASGTVSTAVSTLNLNNEAMVYVAPGLVLSRPRRDPDSGEVRTDTYNGNLVAALIAGLIGGSGPQNSLTYADVPDARSVQTTYSRDEIRSLLTAGVCVLAPAYPPGTARAKVERGITTLVTPGAKLRDFNKIRVVRITDAIAEGLSDAMSTSYVGKVVNSDIGREKILEEIRSFLADQATQENIAPDFTVALDDTQENTGENIFVRIGIRPLDSIEFIFTTVSLG